MIEAVTESTFLERVARSQIVPDAKLAELEKKSLNWGQIPDAQLAAEFVRVGALTRFQADQILSGHTDGLRVGRYCFLEAVLCANGVRSFVAEDVPAQHQLRLALLPQADAGVQSRIERLQEAVAVLTNRPHPYLANVLSLEREGENWLFTSEHPVGKGLHKIVATSGPLAPDRAVRAVAMAACGLSKLHAHGLTHGSIQPSCMVLAPDGVVRVDDVLGELVFGPNRAKPKTLSVSVADAASEVDFVSPEQSWGQTGDHRSDIYRLGLTLHRLLSGKIAFPGSVVQRLAARQARPVPLLAGNTPGVAAELDAVLQRATAPEPAHRYQSVSELVRALSQWLSPGDAQKVQAALVRAEDSPEGKGAAKGEGAAPTTGDEGRPTPWPLIAVGAVMSIVALAAWLIAGR